MPTELSVVVPAVNTQRDVADCLRHLDAQRADVSLEVLLMDRIGVAHDVVGDRPWVRVIPVAKSVTIPQMRAQAFDVASGAAVAVIEDHVMVPPGWARRMLDALAESDGVAAGSVENAATGNLMDWACFLCEYSQLLPPIPGGFVDGVTGNNVVYRRELLEEFRDVTHEGKWENRLHDAVRASGRRLLCKPEIAIGHKKHYTFWEYFSQRYLYARSYAGARVAGAPLGRRLFYGAAAFVLPPLLFVRIVRTIQAKGRHGGLLLKSLPLIATFVVSWGVGEIVGYWFGAGDSLAKVC